MEGQDGDLTSSISSFIYYGLPILDIPVCFVEYQDSQHGWTGRGPDQ